MLIKSVVLTTTRRLRITLEETTWQELDDLQKSLVPGQAIDLEAAVADFIRSELRKYKAQARRQPPSAA